MREPHRGWICLGALALACVGPTAAAGDPATAASSTPTTIPPITATLPSPATLGEADLPGLLRNDSTALLVVNFWASWCQPCVTELATLDRVAQAHPGARFVLLSVDEARDAPKVAAFTARIGVRSPVFQLVGSNVAMAVATAVPAWPGSIPLTLVLEPGGRERARFAGLLRESELVAALALP